MKPVPRSASIDRSVTSASFTMKSSAESLRPALLAAYLLLCGAAASAQEPRLIKGTFVVVDAAGARLESAGGSIAADGKPPIRCEARKGVVECQTTAAGSATVTILAEGFGAATRTLTESVEAPLSVTLEVAVYGSVTVTFDRNRVGSLGRSEVHLVPRDLRETAAPLLDDMLRQTVGFSTFRRSSGRQANPTTQGVSLRGIGASGASRTVVLDEEVPINDPFGGWVQWNQIIPLNVGSIDIVRGGASGTEGSGAVSGTIAVRPRSFRNSFLSGDFAGGTQTTVSASVSAGAESDGWTVSAAAAGFQTRGFIPVEEAVRGRADSLAGVRYNTFNARAQRKLRNMQLVLKPTYFGEVRTNGTGLQTNRTHLRRMAGSVGYSGRRFAVSGNGFATSHVYDQIFSAVSGDRDSESLTRVQRTPASSIGLGATASFVGSGSFTHTTLLGYSMRHTRGASDETVYANGLPSNIVGAGGRENILSAFVTQQATWSGLSFGGAVRYDRWETRRGLSSSRALATNLVTTTSFGPRVVGTVSPRVFANYGMLRGSRSVSIIASFSKSFRAPTLNELYRSFRVGNIVTLADNGLSPERATEYEAGVSYRDGRFGLRASLFRTSLRNTVANVTISVTPSLITRQRKNAGRIVSRGIEVEFETKLDRFGFSAGYLFADSAVREFPSNPALIGKRTVQVPAHQATFQLRYAVAAWTASLQARASTSQFDDDLNNLRLEPYFQTDVMLSYRASGRVILYSAVENVFNSRYSTAKTPVRSVSGPLSVRIGVRFDRE